MSGNKYVLDTNAVLYILAGDESLAQLLFGELLFISIISEIELLSYKNIIQSEQHQIQKFLKEFQICGLDKEIKEQSILVRRTYNLKLPDSIIAATAINLDIPLVTSDKQFKKVKELELLYYEK